jgi:hypothetical protein
LAGNKGIVDEEIIESINKRILFEGGGSGEGGFGFGGDGNWEEGEDEKCGDGGGDVDAVQTSDAKLEEPLVSSTKDINSKSTKRKNYRVIDDKAAKATLEDKDQASVCDSQYGTIPTQVSNQNDSKGSEAHKNPELSHDAGNSSREDLTTYRVAQTHIQISRKSSQKKVYKQRQEFLYHEKVGHRSKSKKFNRRVNLKKYEDSESDPQSSDDLTRKNQLKISTRVNQEILELENQKLRLRLKENKLRYKELESKYLKAGPKSFAADNSNQFSAVDGDSKYKSKQNFLESMNSLYEKCNQQIASCLNQNLPPSNGEIRSIMASNVAKREIVQDFDGSSNEVFSAKAHEQKTQKKIRFKPRIPIDPVGSHRYKEQISCYFEESR